MRPDQDVWEIVAFGIGAKFDEATKAVDLVGSARKIVDAPDADDSVKRAARIVLSLEAFAIRTPEVAWGAMWRAARSVAMGPLGEEKYWPIYAQRHPKLGKMGPPPDYPTVREVYLRRRKDALAAIAKANAAAMSIIGKMGPEVPS
jgi:hypothetical protein